MSPIAPFFGDWLWNHLHQRATPSESRQSVHLGSWPVVDSACLDPNLERRMALAQRLSSLSHGLRKNRKLKVRQPLKRAIVPVLTDQQAEDVRAMADFVAAEINVLAVEPTQDPTFLNKSVKPNFRALGPRLGKQMKAAGAAIAQLSEDQLLKLESGQAILLDLDGTPFELLPTDVEIVLQEIPGFYTATDGQATVALDLELNDELRELGLAREFVNRVQNLRKEAGLEVTDRIHLRIAADATTQATLERQLTYIQDETLAPKVDFEASVESGTELQLDDVTISVALQALVSAS